MGPGVRPTPHSATLTLVAICAALHLVAICRRQLTGIATAALTVVVREIQPAAVTTGSEFRPAIHWEPCLPPAHGWAICRRQCTGRIRAGQYTGSFRCRPPMRRRYAAGSAPVALAAALAMGGNCGREVHRQLFLPPSPSQGGTICRQQWTGSTACRPHTGSFFSDTHTAGDLPPAVMGSTLRPPHTGSGLSDPHTAGRSAAGSDR